MIKTRKEKMLEARITKLERALVVKNESDGPAATALYEAVGEGQLRWKDVADVFLALADDNMCMQVCNELGVEF